MGTFSNRPWTAAGNAVLAGWLGANEKPLTALREAVKRTHSYNPLLPDKAEKGLSGTLHPGLFVCRESWPRGHPSSDLSRHRHSCRWYT